MRLVRPSSEIRDDCPYCGFKFVVDATSIEGELHALRCIDCGEKFVVEVVVSVSHRVDALAGVSSEAVLDRLSDGSADPDRRELPAGDEKLEEVVLSEVGAEHYQGEGSARVNDEPKRALTADELAELRALLAEQLDEDANGEDPDPPPEFVEGRSPPSMAGLGRALEPTKVGLKYRERG